MDPQPGDTVLKRLPRVPQVRLSPNGYVAQRLGCYLDGRGPWVLLYLLDGQLQVRGFGDVDVADWPELHMAPSP